MGDDWEQLYFGRLGVDPNDDPDGDDFNNRTEFLAGTDPTCTDTRPVNYNSGIHPQTCPGEAVQVTLVANDDCSERKTFSIVSQPSSGQLGAITPDPYNPNQAIVTYTADEQSCGEITFTYKSSNGLLESDPASPGTATIDVGDPSPQANPQDAMTGVATPVTLTLSGWHVLCESDPLTFAVESDPANGDITAFDPATGSVTYQPHAGFEGLDWFTFSAGDCGFSSGPQTVNILVVSAPTLTTYCREHHLVLQWTLPDSIQPYSDSLTFTIYRRETTPGNPCTPTFYDTSLDPNYYVDTDVESGKEYCYQVTFSYQDQYTVRPYESLPSPVAHEQLCPVPSILITGNRYGGGGIVTYDFTDGSRVQSFIPDVASNGRGLAVFQGYIYYSDLSDPNTIHACPYGNEGSGGSDDPSKTIQNTWRSGVPIQDLAFHGGYLYVFSGYPDLSHPSGYPLQVHKVDLATKTAVSAIWISGPNSDADGFTLLSNGNLLINDGDFQPTYNEYSAGTGALVQGGLSIDVRSFGAFATSTGVCTAPDDSLYFIAGPGGSGPPSTALIHTLGKEFISEREISVDGIEDIDVVAP